MNEQHRLSDEALLASLGYKQEFQRAFAPLEVFGIAFSIIGLLPSIASVLVYAIPNGSAAAMVWGWLSASILILFIGMSMAELASSAPMSGGVCISVLSTCLYLLMSPLSFIIGLIRCTHRDPEISLLGLWDVGLAFDSA